MSELGPHKLAPQALEELMAKDVEQLTSEDIDNFIAHLRSEREAFVVAEAAGKRPPKTTKVPDPALMALITDVLGPKKES